MIEKRPHISSKDKAAILQGIDEGRWKETVIPAFEKPKAPLPWRRLGKEDGKRLATRVDFMVKAHMSFEPSGQELEMLQEKRDKLIVYKMCILAMILSIFAGMEMKSSPYSALISTINTVDQDTTHTIKQKMKEMITPQKYLNQ